MSTSTTRRVEYRVYADPLGDGREMLTYGESDKYGAMRNAASWGDRFLRMEMVEIVVVAHTTEQATDITPVIADDVARYAAID